MTHELKIWPCFYNPVLNYQKRFEVRIYDRPYKVGDVLVLSEYDLDRKEYTGRSLKANVLFLLLLKMVIGDSDYIAMSISEPYDIVEAK